MTSAPITQNKSTERDTTTQEEVGIPARPAPLAEVIPPRGQAALLSVSLSLEEIGATAASLQTMVHMGIVRQPTQLNVINSVLRKFHDAKVEYAKTLP